MSEAEGDLANRSGRRDIGPQYFDEVHAVGEALVAAALAGRMEPLSLAGVTEAADILGVTKQRVVQLRERTDFPVPFAIAGTSRSLWLPSHLTRFAVDRFDLGRQHEG